jgi:mannose-6-phosphate isomerase-like protein (cupin superfamily)
VTILELEPDGKGKEHDHATDGQEEVYVCVDGRIDVDFDDGSVTLGANEAVRVDPAETRQLHNRGDERARLVLVGGPL